MYIFSILTTDEINFICSSKSDKKPQAFPNCNMNASQLWSNLFLITVKTISLHLGSQDNTASRINSSPWTLWTSANPVIVGKKLFKQGWENNGNSEESGAESEDLRIESKKSKLGYFC